MKAEIVSIGTELLLGTITDTNAAYLAQKLATLGIDCYYISQVGDNLERLEETLARAWARSDLTITTGGLGPTQDDLTREAIAAVVGETPEVDPELEKQLRWFFQRRGVAMPESNLKQATLIRSAQALPNPVGTAPGWWVARDNGGGRYIVAMPGVPFEMKRMWEQEVEPRLGALSSEVLVSRTLKVLGLGESTVDGLVADLMSGANPTLAPYAKADGVHLRISAKASNRQAALGMIAEIEAQVRSRLGDAVYGADDETPWEVTRKVLKEYGAPYAVLEIGEEARGVIVPLVEGSALAVGALYRPSLDDSDELGDAVTAVASTTHASVVLGLEVTTREPEAAEGVVQADASIAVLVGNESGAVNRVQTRQSWRTARSEVGRLAGLAAVNFLRRELLARGNKDK